MKKVWLAVFYIAFTVLLLWSLQKALDLEAPPSFPSAQHLVFAFMAHFIVIGLIAFRLKRSMSGLRGWWGYLAVLDLSLLHNFLVTALPARIADVYYPFLLSQRTGESVGGGVGNLILLRVMDVAAIGGLVLLALPWVGTEQLDTKTLYFVLGGLAGLMALAAMRLARLLECLAIALRRARRYLHFINMLLRPALQARRWAKKLSRFKRLELFILSLVIWGMTAFTFHALFIGFGINLTISQTVVAAELTNLGGAVPAQAIAGIGVGEGIMAGLLVAYGNPISVSALFAIWSRVIISGLIFLMFGLRCLVVLMSCSASEQTKLERLFGPAAKVLE